MKRKQHEVAADDVITKHDLMALFRRGLIPAPKRKKYSFIEPKPQLLECEQNYLARLVAKYGSETVVKFVEEVLSLRRRSRGRPAFSLEEADNLLWFIQREIEDGREANSRHPVADAFEAVCEVTGLSLKTVKDKRRAAVKLVAQKKGAN